MLSGNGRKQYPLPALEIFSHQNLGITKINSSTIYLPSILYFPKQIHIDYLILRHRYPNKGIETQSILMIYNTFKIQATLLSPETRELAPRLRGKMMCSEFQNKSSTMLDERAYVKREFKGKTTKEKYSQN